MQPILHTFTACQHPSTQQESRRCPKFVAIKIHTKLAATMPYLGTLCSLGMSGVCLALCCPALVTGRAKEGEVSLLAAACTFSSPSGNTCTWSIDSCKQHVHRVSVRHEPTFSCIACFQRSIAVLSELILLLYVGLLSGSAMRGLMSCSSPVRNVNMCS